jgi:hypothetical protein
MKAKAGWLHLIVLAALIPWLTGFAGCQNLYGEIADKKSDAALMYQAKMHIDRSEFTSAINAMNRASAASRDSRQGRVVIATAYAGRCGLNLITLAEQLANMGSDTLFRQLMVAFKSATVVGGQAADCQQAESLLMGIPGAQRNSSDNVFLAFTSMSKIGAYLGQSSANDSGTGNVAAGFNACNTGEISDSEIRQIGSGLMTMMAAFDSSGAPVLDNLTAILDPFCTALETATGATTCDKTDPDDFDATELKFLRSMLRSNEIGLNTCNNSITDPACVCP